MSLNIPNSTNKITEGNPGVQPARGITATEASSSTTNTETEQPVTDATSTQNVTLTNPVLTERLKYAQAAREHQERTLIDLREKIRIKKQEFTEHANGPNGTEEERMDLERALGRFDRLIELPESEMIREFHGIFNLYSKPLSRLLDCNARALNFVLATTFIPSPSDLNYEVKLKEGLPPTYNDFLKKMIHHLPSWEFITRDFSPDPDNYFYLPGLPIVIQRTIRRDCILRFMVDRGIERRNDRLTADEEEKFIKMATLIRENKWLEFMPESLRQTESFTFANVASCAGIASRRGHPIIKLDDSTTPLQLADSGIHEDCHHHLNAQPGAFEIGIYETEHFQRTHCHKHPWDESGRCTSLLSECFTYNTEGFFRLLGLENDSLTNEEKFESIEILCRFRGKAKSALEILHKNIERLNDTGRKWLTDAEQRWENLNNRFQNYLDNNIDSFLGSKSFSSRECGYKAVDNTWIHYPEKREEYTLKYQCAMKRESNCYVVAGQTDIQNKPNELRRIAQTRLQEDKIFNELYESLRKNLTSDDPTNRSFGYTWLTKAWNACLERKNNLVDLFRQAIEQEADMDCLKGILEIDSLPEHFRTPVISKIEASVKPK